MSFWPFTAGAKRPIEEASPPTPPRPAKRPRTKPPTNSNITTTTTTTNTENTNDGENNSPPDPTTDPKSRWDPAIDPSSPAFQAALASFTALLRDPSHTVDSVVALKFAPHERALLLLPSFRASASASADDPSGGDRDDCNSDSDDDDRSADRVLAAVREANRRRYAALLRSPRFRPYAGRGADLAFKLTVAWFGLPVEPVQSAVEGGRLGEQGEGSDGRRSDGEEDELGFLDAYREGGVFGRDGVRSKCLRSVWGLQKKKLGVRSGLMVLTICLQVRIRN